MAYLPIQLILDNLLKIPTEPQATTGSLPVNAILNKRDDNQLVRGAVLSLKNYWKSGIGKLMKSPSLTLDYQITTGGDAGSPVRVYEWGDEFQVVFLGTSIAVRDIIAETTSVIEDQTLTKGATDGQKYGDFFYTCNGYDGDHIGVIRAKIDYDTETAPFTVGKVLTGGTSGFTGEILEVDDNGTTGTLYLGNVNGRPTTGETITDSATGSAKADGVLGFEWKELTNTKKCGTLGINSGNRLIAGDTEDGRSKVNYSRVDQLTGIPWETANDWTSPNTPNTVEDAGIVSFRNGGVVKAIGEEASQIVALLDHGSLGFRIDQVNIETTGLIQSVQIDYQSVDWGSSRGIVNTPDGILFVNDYGVSIKRPTGRGDKRYAMADTRLSELLGVEFFKNFDTSEAEIVEDKLREIVIITAKKDSATNNIQLVYHKKKELRGWSTWNKPLKGVFRQNNKIYGTSSLDSSVYELDYSVGDDEGLSVDTEVEFEPQLNAFGGLAQLQEIFLEGKFTKGENIVVEVDIKDRKGVWRKNHCVKTLTTTSNIVATSGLGVGGVGEEGLGGGADGFDTSPNNFIHFAIPTADFILCRVRVKTSSVFVHTLNKISLSALPRGKVGYT